MIPDWFSGAIREGLAGLYILNMQNNPPAESTKKIAEFWVHLTWVSNKWDAPDIEVARIRNAFQWLAVNTNRFPVPKDFIAALPDKPIPIALPAPEYPKEKAAANRKKLAEMVKPALDKINQKFDHEKIKRRQQYIQTQKEEMDIWLKQREAKIEQFSVEKGGSICPHSGFDCVYFQDFTEALAYQLALAYSKGKRPKSTEQERHDHANRVKKKFLPAAIQFLRK